MPDWFDALVFLVIIWVFARLIKRRVGLLQRYFIPSSIIGGTLLLLAGPQLFAIVPAGSTNILSLFPALLINVVFAGLFLGKSTPGPRQIWNQAGPMIAFGGTIAWGMYVIGILLTLLVLTPLFGAPPIFATLLEISFTGGHGTAAGLAPMFAELGWPDATDMALGLATFSIITAVIVGIAIINIYNRRAGRVFDRAAMVLQQKRMIRNGYSLVRVTSRFERNPRELIIVAIMFGLAIAIGWLILQLLIWLESLLLSDVTTVRFFVHLPLFPLAMFGGLIVQILLSRTNLSEHLNQKTVQTIGTIALDLLIITAIGTMSLNVIGANLPAFIILAFSGVAWILSCFYFLAPRIFRRHWFVYGITDTGQALGMTATGLLLNRLADPANRTGVREAFAYKQLAFEPFMGGGVVTAMAAITIVEIGQMPALVIATFFMFFWLIVGLLLGSRNRQRWRRYLRIGNFVMGR